MASKSIKKNMIMNTMLTFSTIVFPLITYPYVTRVLLPIGVGKVYFALSVMTYFAMFAQLGIPVYGVRECARVRDNKVQLTQTVKELLTVNLLMLIPVYAVYIPAVMLVPQLRNEWPMYVIMGISIGLTAINTDWFYQAIEEYSYITIRSLIFKTIGLIATFVLINNPKHYVVYGGIMVFATSASSIWNLKNLKRYMAPTTYQIKPKTLLMHLRTSIKFFMLSVMTTVYTNLDIVMLGFLADETAVGYYGIAVKIKLALVGAITAMSAVVLPRASNYISKQDHEKFFELLSKTMNLVVVFSIACTIYTMLCADEISDIIAGEAFVGTSSCLTIMAMTLVPISISNVIGMQMLIPLGRERLTVISVTVAAVCDIALNIMLIPVLKELGAAIGTLTAEVVVVICLLIMTWQIGHDNNKRLLSLLFRGTNAYKIMFAAVISGLAVVLCKLVIRDDILTVIAAGCVFVLVYFGILYMLKEAIAVELVGIVKRKIRK